MQSEVLRAALRIAVDAHRAQTDRAGQPYLFHPLTVAGLTESDDAFIAALLHDVMEDSDYTAADLLAAGIPAHIVDALRLLTHDPAEPYLDYVRRIRENPLAAAVKRADLTHNSDLSRLPTVTEKDLARAEKYRQALALLDEKAEKSSV